MLEPIADRRAVIDRRGLADRIAGKRKPTEITQILTEALASGREEIARRLAQEPGRGRAAARATAFLHDQIVRLAYDSVTPGAQTMALVGLGGTGRGEMAPYSDLDLMFLTKTKPSQAECDAAQAILHVLWNLKLKVGHSLRSIPELMALAKKDMTVRTAFLEARLLWGEETLFDLAMTRFRKDIVAGTGAQFVAAKLAERDARHVRMGDSRYVVEPNIKDGKGGLRDLHTLYWIGKYIHAVERPSDLVAAGLLTATEFASFERAERFLWAVRCHLHLAAGRAEERLGFDHQRHIATVMNYADRPGKSAVERFMQFYFLNAKTVGDLTGLFLAQLDEQLGKKGFRFALPTIRRRPKRLDGFTLDRGRLSIPSDGFLAERDERHRRMGDSRYVVEHNVKDGKGGLRDLHTLYWIGQYLFGVDRPAELVAKGLFTEAEYRRFERAERFFWSVRCHLHLAAGRAEERLGFDHQRQIAAAMNYADRPGKS
ncbi:MAG: hypothetical protein ABIN68_03565, partial [Sphingomicrobium sp.]